MSPMTEAVRAFLDYWGRGAKARENLVFFIWDDAVGAEIAKRSRPRAVQSGVLYVDAESPVVANVFQTEAHRIRDKLNHLLEQEVIKEVRFSSRGFERQPRARLPRAALTPSDADLEQVALDDKTLAEIEGLCASAETPELRNLLAYVATRVAKIEAWRKKKRWKKCPACGVRFRGKSDLCEPCRVKRNTRA